MKRFQIPRSLVVLGLAATWTLGLVPGVAPAAHAARGWGVRDRDRDGIPDYRERNTRNRVRTSSGWVRGDNGVRYYRDRSGNLSVRERARGDNRVRYVRERARGDGRVRYYRDAHGNLYTRDNSGRRGYSQSPGSRQYRNRYGTTRYENGSTRSTRDRDRDGIADYRDWDRDGDGIANDRDRAPNRYSRDQRYGGTYSGRANNDWDRDGVLNWNDHWPRDRRRQ